MSYNNFENNETYTTTSTACVLRVLFTKPYDITYPYPAFGSVNFHDLDQRIINFIFCCFCLINGVG